METTKLSSKGQVILPTSVRRARNWQPGTTFSVENVEDGVLLKPLQPFKPTKLDSVFGCLQANGKVATKSRKPASPASIESMDKAIVKTLRARRASGRY